MFEIGWALVSKTKTQRMFGPQKLLKRPQNSSRHYSKQQKRLMYPNVKQLAARHGMCMWTLWLSKGAVDLPEIFGSVSTVSI